MGKGYGGMVTISYISYEKKFFFVVFYPALEIVQCGIYFRLHEYKRFTFKKWFHNDQKLMISNMVVTICVRHDCVKDSLGNYL